MNERNRLSKSERLCSERRIEALFEGGRRGTAGPLKFCWIASPTTPEAEQTSEIAGAAGVAVLFSVPKKFFKRAWKRNLIKRRLRESYRQRKHHLVAAAEHNGQQIDIAFVCVPPEVRREKTSTKAGKTTTGRTRNEAEIPDFKTIDDAIAKILEKIAAQNRN